MVYYGMRKLCFRVKGGEEYRRLLADQHIGRLSWDEAGGMRLPLSSSYGMDFHVLLLDGTEIGFFDICYLFIYFSIYLSSVVDNWIFVGWRNFAHTTYGRHGFWRDEGRTKRDLRFMLNEHIKDTKYKTQDAKCKMQSFMKMQ